MPDRVMLYRIHNSVHEDARLGVALGDTVVLGVGVEAFLVSWSGTEDESATKKVNEKSTLW